jgi:PilZ domain
MRILQSVLHRYGAKYSGPERRRSKRKRVVATAWVLSQYSTLPIVAVLWDISLLGARLTVADCNALSDRFALLIARDERPGLPCRVAWRSGQQIGIEFLAPMDPAVLETWAGSSAPAKR